MVEQDSRRPAIHFRRRALSHGRTTLHRLTLTVSFGLVAIPVKLYTATQSGRTRSPSTCCTRTCGSRLRQQYVCIKDGSIVERDEMIKGYEFAKDQYVHFTPEEIKALEEAGTHAVEISEFVPVESIDPVYFDKTYYLVAGQGRGNKPYGLLIEAMKEAKLRPSVAGRRAARRTSCCSGRSTTC